MTKRKLEGFEMIEIKNFLASARNRIATQIVQAVVVGAALCSGVNSTAASVTFAQAPLLTLKVAPGLVMLTMGRDLSLSKSAYNDLSDLDGDGLVDQHFKPGFRYEGYFAYDRCYSYASNVFTPAVLGTKVVVDANNSSKDYYKCATGQAQSAYWSGNFLNWVTMSRMDVLRKVLYGGKRSTDTSSATVLERTYVPQDSTIWGKDYASYANDGYYIQEFTPLAQPISTSVRHMFANVTLGTDNDTTYGYYPTTTLNPPLMRVYANRTGRLWDLVATDATILSTGRVGLPTADYVVRVTTCVSLSGQYEDWCSGYPVAAPTAYKPTGLLHKYGIAKTLAFGLLTGTYDNNYSGGVLRQNVDDFTQEVVASSGIFDTSVKGVIYHLNTLRPWGFATVIGGNAVVSQWDCDYLFTSARLNGNCMMWGNPLGEMMYEGLRYFSGAGTPTTAYTTGVATISRNISTASGSKTLISPEPSTRLNLQRPAWINPYATVTSGRKQLAAYPICARPMQMVIGDPRTSYDSDQLPGSSFTISTGFGPAFTGTGSTLGSLNVSTEADAIWTSEFGAGVTKKFFVGEGGGVADGNPSAKTVSSFKNIRGHGPDGTTDQGSFYGASVARYGKFTGLTNSARGASADTLRVDQISVALDSTTPQIKVPLNGKTISIVPLSKSVSGQSISNAKGGWQTTGAITGFFIDSQANTDTGNTNAAINSGRPYYKFRISYSDSGQGSDNETDAIVIYEIKATSTTNLTIGMQYVGGINTVEMHQGYVISGTDADGVYLDVGGASSSSIAGPPVATAVGYFLDTMPNKVPGSAELSGTGPNYTNISTRLPLTTIASPRNFKTGTGSNGEFVPHDMLWYAAKYGGATRDSTGGFNFKLDPTTGDPENYFLANNPSQLSTQMGQAFQKAAALSAATSSAVSGNGVRVGGGSYVYQAGYDTVRWGGDLSSFLVDANGGVASTTTWQATTSQPTPSLRNIVLGRGGTAQITINSNSYSSLSSTEKTAFKDTNTFQYLMGVRSSEQSNGGTLRNRSSIIGDVVNSDPLYINTTDFGYSDTAYASFKSNAPQLVGFGSNDGFYRLVSGTDGVEKLAFIPQAVLSKLTKLAVPAYDHDFYVDGPSTFGHAMLSGSWKAVMAGTLGAGGKSVFAINVTATSPASAPSVLWEYNNDNDLGYVINKPIVGQLENDTGVVIIGNGLNSTTDRAAIMVINAATGALIRTCMPTDATNASANGMGSIAFVSTNSNGKISYVYGADYKGNVWRFDPNSSSCGTTATKLFRAINGASVPQPITGELTIINAPTGKSGYMVLFGTGSYISAADATTTRTESLYGIWDDLGTGGVTRAKLVQQTINAATSSDLSGTRTTSTVATNNAWYEQTGNLKGWYLDLTCPIDSPNTTCVASERTVAKPTILNTSSGQRVFFLSIVPGSDPCAAGGYGWLTSLNPTTGGYIKGLETIDANSTRIDGVTPRGLFLVQRTKTTGNSTTDILYVSVNVSNNVVPAPRGQVSSGGLKITGDGSGTAVIGIGVSPAVVTINSFGTRRQVWRQIQ